MDKIWLRHYQEQVPHEINLNQYTSLVTLFESACTQYGPRTAYINMNSCLTFDDLNAQSNRFAIYLQQQGLKKGDRVAIMLPNVLQYPVLLFGILRAGGIVVNMNPLYTCPEIVHQMNDCGAETIIVLTHFAHLLETALPEIPALKHVITTELADLFAPIKRLIVNFTLRYIKRMIPTYRIHQAVTLHSILKSSIKAPFHPVELNHQDIAFIQYTGGTTGVSKGAILTHGNLVANILQASCWIEPLGITSDDVIVTALPLYHIFSLTANCLTFLKFGSQNILITNPRDTKRLIDDIKHRHISAFTGVNTLFNTLLNHANFDQIDFSGIKLSLSGGMALQKSVSLNWQQRTHSRILEAYGLTEASPAVTMNPMYLTSYNGSVGLPLPSTDISIRNEQGQELPLGESGELCVKGPQVMPGYWQRQDESDLVFWPDGFLRTGDIAKLDAEGFVYLVDRRKDLILVSGFNVYPNEVEQVISLMPEVLEVGVVGIQKEDAGEQVKACIVKRHPALTALEVIAHCRKHLAGYKVPKLVAFYNELPKTSVGKISRRELK